MKPKWWEEELQFLASLLDRETIGDGLADTLFVETQFARPISDERARALWAEFARPFTISDEE